MKILLATDGSQPATEAVKFVRSLARNSVIDVVVLTVSFDPSLYAFQPWVPEWTEHEEQVALDILDQAKQSLDDVCENVTLVHKSGPAVPCILKQAQTAQVDLIVLGAKGRSAISRVLLGSVSDSVATSAKCSVAVVRPTDTENIENKDAKKIVVGFDKSVAAREAISELMEWNFHRDCQIEVVSVAMQDYVFVGEGYEGPPIGFDFQRAELARQAADRMASHIADHFPDTKVQTPVAQHVGEALVNAAEAAKADWLVVGDTGHSLLGEFLLGSTTKYVLRHAPCSVWISRHHWNADMRKQATEQAANRSS